MKRIVFATSNEGKMVEVRKVLRDLNVEIYSLSELDLNFNIEENGSTFEENAFIKASKISEITGEIVIADDSGIEIDFLGKAPGVNSARFLGEETPYHIKNRYILDRMINARGEERSARFVCAMVCIFPNGKILRSKGTLEGYIAYESKGDNGFGYDPIFYLPQFKCTTAQMTIEEKNKISHRGKALRVMKKAIKDLYKNMENGKNESPNSK